MFYSANKESDCLLCISSHILTLISDFRIKIDDLDIAN